ncbi:uncharacterized protein [Dendropsophus ebraccatus]|uniref:uncharacterized protein n=1 Tax=Dendropsophus ebraccatus TaxID=150705 RepID=UPI003831411E
MKTSRTKSRECPVCDRKLSSHNKTLCSSCRNRFLEEETPSFMRDIKELIKGEIKSSLPSQTLVPVETGESSRSEPRPGPSTVADEEDPMSETEDFDSTFPKLVDPEKKSGKGGSLGTLRRSHPNYRCQPSGLGSLHNRHHAPGVMEARGSCLVSERQRAEGSLHVPIPGPTPSKRQTCKGPVRQLIGSSVHKSPGGHKIQRANESRTLHLQTGRTSSLLPHSTTSKGVRECKSRLPEQTPVKPGGVELVSRSVSADLCQMGSSSNRSLRLQSEQKGREVLLPEPIRQPDRDRCASPSLESGTPVCLPPVQDDPQSSQEGQAGQSSGHHDSAILAQEGVVLLVEGHVSYRSLGSTRDSGSSQSGSNLPSGSQESPPDSMAIERQILIDRGLSEQVITTLLASKKRVTSEIYLRTWRAFCRFVNKPINVLVPPDIPVVLDFLQEGLNKRLRPSTIRVQISALSSLFDFKLAEHPWVRRFMRATDRIFPSIKPKLPPWDLNLVLSQLTEPPFEPLADLSIKILSQKLAFLLAITSARRVGEISAFSIQQPYMSIREDRVILSPDPAFLPKVVSDFHRSQEVVLPSFCPNPSNEGESRFHCLDVRRCLIHYLQNTEQWRLSNNILILFQGKNRGKAASAQVIAKWIKNTISSAYITAGIEVPSGFGAHSTRSVATSWAERASVSIEQICRAATWSSPHTFFKGNLSPPVPG